MSESPLEDAWSCIRAAREHDWTKAPSCTWPLGKGTVTVECGGTWHCHDQVHEGVPPLLDNLMPLAARDRPLVIAQLGQSLDGRIATITGASHYVNGLDSRVHLHRLRALVDAVLVGAGTVEADNPQLNVRHVAGRNPVRVVVDPRGRVDTQRHVFQCGDAPTLHLIGDGARTAGAVGMHVERIVMPVNEAGHIEPQRIIEILAAHGHERVLVEGGSVTVSRFLEAGALHRLHMLIAPLLIGSGRPGLELSPVTTLDQALRPHTRTFRCGDDMLFDLLLAESEVS